MKSFTKAVMIALIVLSFTISFSEKTVEAADVTYHTVKDDKSKKFSNSKGNSIKLDYYYKRIELSGSSKGVKRINKQLKSYSDKFMADKESTYKFVEESLKDYSGQTFSNIVDSKVTYNKKGIISIVVETFWSGGQVNSTATYGYTFRLKDGKCLNITNVCTGGKTNIQNAIWSKAKAAKINIVNPKFTKSSINVSKVNFYVKSDSQVVVCFNYNELLVDEIIKCTISRNLSSSSKTSSSKKPSSTLVDGVYFSEFLSKSDAKNSSYAKKYGNIYKLGIKGNKVIMYGSFSKDGKKYSSKKREFVMVSSFRKSLAGKGMISNIKKHITKSAYFSFTIKNNEVTNMTFAG